ncbi:MAG: NAD(P)/FAD-dependent oxidoreductase [Candidatus Heimdallarchaeota archaeon]
MIETEVLVVGGGPAGVIAATTAAKAGRQVTLVDSKPHEEIGNKVCGDALDIEPIKFLREKLGIEFPHGNEVSDIVKTLLIQARDLGFPIKGEKLGYVVNRHNYGQRLLLAAEKAGVEVKDRIWVKSPLVDNASVMGVKFKDLKDNSIGEIKSKVTIDCSGYKCTVRKNLPHDKFPLLEPGMRNEDVMVSYREIVDLRDGLENHDYANTIALIYKDDIPVPGYFWVFSEGDYRLNLGICYYREMKTSESTRNLYQRILERDYYTSDQFTINHAQGYQIPVRYPLLNAVADGFLTAGDAAHHVDPFTAEGHGPALIAGYYAGMTAADAIETGDTSQEKLWSYNKAVMDHFGSQQCKTQVFTNALCQIGVSGLEFMFKREVISSDALLELNEGNGPSRTDILRLLVRLFPRYNILRELGRVAHTTSKLSAIIDNYPAGPDQFPMWSKRFMAIMHNDG